MFKSKKYDQCIQWSRKKVLPLFFFLVFLSLFYLHTRGIFYPDEGYMLHTTTRIMAGQVPYRDFDFVYTPLSPLFAILPFFFFGQSIFVARMTAMLVSLATVFVFFHTAKLLTKRFLLQIMPICIYIAWGPAHINFLWPTMVAVLFGIANSYAFLKTGFSKSGVWPFLAGVFAMCVVLSKQNLGLAVIASGFLFLFFCKTIRKKRIWILFTAGLLSVILLFAFWLFVTHSASSFLANFYLHILRKIVVEGTINTPLLYGSSVYSHGKLLFYFSPFILSIYATYLSFRHNRKYLILPLFSSSIFLAGFRPVTDYVHLSPLLSLSGLPLLVILLFRKKTIWVSSLYVLGLLTLGVLMPFFVAYYRWSEPLIRQNYFISDSRVNIWVDRKYSQEIPLLRSTINTISKTGEPIYINYYAPMLYFLLDRKNGTRYDYISANAVTLADQKNLIKDLEKNHVRIIITHDLARTDKSIVAKYIEKKYTLVKKINDLSILVDRSETESKDGWRVIFQHR